MNLIVNRNYSVFCLGIILVIALASQKAFSQLSDKLKHGMIFYTDAKDSSHFVKLNVTNQVWVRYTENDPSTLVTGVYQKNTTDISIRRVRFVLSGQLTDRLSFFIQFGQNNLNYLSGRKSGAFIHDATADFALIKKKLSLGFGLNGWNGPSRFSNTSVSSITVLDPPNFQEVTNDTYDQFVRRLGFYVKGKLGKLDYRLSAAKPFTVNGTVSGLDPLNSKSSTFNTNPPKFVYQGYFMWQFLDQESNFAPSTQGTYLGAKRVFNIGAGFYYQNQAMMISGAGAPTDTTKQDIRLFSIDAYYDAPLNKDKGTAISLYGSFSNYNYGTNFLKVTGPDNPATSSSVAGASLPVKNSFGNAFPYLGTGNVAYLQGAYKFKNNLLGEEFGTIQLYANGQLADWQRLDGDMYVWDAGINWLIRGHNQKFTLDYQNRPYFLENSMGQLVENRRLSQVVLQYQVAF